MPIKPQPTLIKCSQCGWQTIYAPPSDALVMPLPTHCPQCGSIVLNSKPVGMADRLMAALPSFLKP